MALRFKILFCAVLIFLKYRFILADDTNNTIKLNKSTSDKMAAAAASKGLAIEKALRYGFQNTHECKDFEKAFICVSKCLDLGYDASRADRKCKCTCFKVKDKAKYTVPRLSSATKKFTTPTTKLPIWALPKGYTGESQVSKIPLSGANQTDNEHSGGESKTESTGQGGNEPMAHIEEALETDAPASTHSDAEVTHEDTSETADAEHDDAPVSGDAEADAHAEETEAPEEPPPE